MLYVGSVCVCVCVCVCIDDRVWDNGVVSVIRNYPHTSRSYNIITCVHTVMCTHYYYYAMCREQVRG